MDPQGEAAPPPRTERQLVVERRFARRAPGPWAWALVVLLPLALAAVIGWTRGPAVQEALRAEAKQALAAAGLTGVRVAADGRQLTAQVPTGRDPDRVRRVLAGLAGSSAVAIERVYANAAEAKACAGIQRKLDRATDGRQVDFVGQTPRLAPAGEAQLRQVATLLEACRAVSVVVGGHSDTATRNFSTLSLERARVMVTFLERAGIAGERLEARGYGDQFPVDEDDTPAARARNERGTVTVEEQ